MKQAVAFVRRLEQIDSQRAEIHLECPEIRPEPGQFVLADTGGYLLQALFPRQLQPAGFTFETDLAAASRWQPGALLNLLGPAGRPHRPPETARNLLLIHTIPGPLRLLPLALDFRAGHRSVTLLFSDANAPIGGLPDEFEIVRGVAISWQGQAQGGQAQGLPLREYLAWADAVYADVPAGEREGLKQALALARPLGSAAAWTLAAPPMPCGVGACGVCTVRTRSGWRHDCTDGPLFPLAQLEV